MPIEPALLAILACPVCRLPLEVRPWKDGGAEGLGCAECDRIYPVRDGIPELLPECASMPGGTGS